ncbi:MAG: hypothetical protein C4520_15325 [Candidatus Abyssobacteria bacterium SURF_5]|uniref:Lin0512 family protein n=1 Tax=Abyssobacteria bacterium (strain SURF_5) TaxID=2093360 RepID=A0A3A4NH50_ABYX5|nr:MAG: hypothetical protein C4520_15325 [Candidatus Abyssubacteria bacterium SURF_5]
MPEKRFVVEIGMGVDLHGQDVTTAAARAVRDAISRNCLCGLSEICGLTHPDQMHVHVLIACPKPAEVDKEAVLKELPLGKKTITVREGGMTSPGLYVPQLGDASEDIVVANASVIVSVDAPS